MTEIVKRCDRCKCTGNIDTYHIQLKSSGYVRDVTIDLCYFCHMKYVYPLIEMLDEYLNNQVEKERI